METLYLQHGNTVCSTRYYCLFYFKKKW